METDAIVAIKDKDPWQARVKFLQAIEEWAWSGPNRKGTPFEEWPEMPRMIWTLNNAFPTKLTGTDMKSDGNEVAVESIEIAYETLKVAIA